MHSHNYRVPEPFQDQTVVVIGDGPSAKDISLEISKVAKEVHLSSRSPNIKISKLDIGDNMWQHSKIDHVDGNGEVTFQEGVSVNADIILHCTGYKYCFPFLKTEGIVSVVDNHVGPLYKHIFPPQLAPNLSFVGVPYKSFEYSNWLVSQVGLAGVLEQTRSIQTSYFKFIADKGVWRRKEWQLGYGIQE